MNGIERGTPRRTLALAAALALFAASLAALALMHPHTPYKAFLRGTAPVAALWLVLGAGFGWHRDARRLRLVLAVTAAAAYLLAAAWCLHPQILTPLPMAWAAPAMIGLWLAALFVAALLSGALNRYFRHGPMTALGAAAVAYALASGFLPLPFGPQAMTAGMLWLAVWQGVYLYNVPDFNAPNGPA